jgi:enoyl-CoA hydratase
MDGTVVIRREGGVAIIVLARADARNAMNAGLARQTVDAIEASQDAGAIVLTGADPAFCAGLDLRDLGVDRLADLPQFVAAATASEVPIVAAVNGPAVTGGLELALACDFIVASERARFADTHLQIGVYPGPVLVELPRRVGMAWAREMSLTGNFVDADTALRIGLVNHLVPHNDLLPFAVNLAHAAADHDPRMVRAMRRVWDETDRLPIAEAHAHHVKYARSRGFTDATGADIAARREYVLRRAHQQSVSS